MFNGQLKKGVCESCSNEAEQTLTLQHNSIWMCDDCRAKEFKTIKAIESTNQVIQSARRIDESVLIEADLFNAGTVAQIEIKAAIQADDSIPEGEKDFVYTQECERRLKHQTDIVFNLKNQLKEAENQRKVWQIATQEAASKLRAEQRILFAKVDVSYQPSIKSIKSKEPQVKKSGDSVKRVRIDTNEVIAAAKKYNVDASILSMMLEGGKGKRLFDSIDAAAQSLSKAVNK